MIDRINRPRWISIPDITLLCYEIKILHLQIIFFRGLWEKKQPLNSSCLACIFNLHSIVLMGVVMKNTEICTILCDEIIIKPQGETKNTI